MAEPQIIEADFTWMGNRFERSAQVEVGRDGRIVNAGALGRRPTKRLAGKALLPGFINVHSHAFQRGLRGRGETFPEGSGSFWSWREAMYALVDRLDAPALHRLSLQAFREMLAAGITTVGEFHYVHHDATGAGWSMDEVILSAAAEAGIRLVLLNTYYATGGIGRPLAGAQRRFACASPTEYWRQMDRLSGMLNGATQSLGAVAHSVRAASIDDIAALHEESRRRGMVFHMHVEEQRREIEECMDAHGASPMAMLNERLAIDRRFTAVHCTHTDPLEMERFLASGGTVCLCPISEANLGDGVADVPGILDSGGAVCIGFDANSRISMTEELRWLEYVQRLEGERRGVVVDESGDVAPALMKAATLAGAASLGVDAGEIRPGAWADFAVVDLSAPSLAGWAEIEAETGSPLLTALILGASDSAIAGACVGGNWL